MQDELNLLHVTHTVVLDEVHNLVKATRSLSAIIANGPYFQPPRITSHQHVMLSSQTSQMLRSRFSASLKF